LRRKKMKNTVLFLLILALAGFSAQAEAGGRIKVVASSLDMADLVQQVGGDRVDVYSVYRGRTDMHFFEPVPSQVMKLKRADMLVVVGLDADVWMRALIDAARNPDIRFGAPGYVDPSDGIRPIQVPQGRIDGSMGHVHPYGNPHYWFTPVNLRTAVVNIYDGLVRISPEDESFFRANMEGYLEEMERTFIELKEKIAPFTGTAVLEYHRSWDYFCEYLGLDIVATIEPKPGIPPSGRHLSEVIRTAESMGARLILVEPYYPEKPVRKITGETGAVELRIPLYLGSEEGIDSVLDLIRHNVDRVVQALSMEGNG
jgi:zinc/manganese transport system substrate-binding protein